MQEGCHRKDERDDISLGDLMAAVKDAAFDPFGNQRIAYLIGDLALEQIFKRAPIPGNPSPETSEDPLSGDVTFH